MSVRSDLHQFADTLPSPAAEALLKYARWLTVHEGAALTEGTRLREHEPAHCRSLMTNSTRCCSSSWGDDEEGIVSHRVIAS
jgi:hypothetical protein